MGVLEFGLLVVAVGLLVAGGSVGIAAARSPLGVDEWRDAGLVSPEQAEAIRARMATAHLAARRAAVARALGVLGATTVGAGTILFFAANWSDIPRFLRLAILLAGIAVLYAAAFWLLEVRRTRTNTGHGLVLVGAVLFGTAIFLVGQMYNVQAHDPLAFLLWSGGAFASALFFRSPPTAGLAILAFEAWIVHELVEYGDDYDSAAFIPFALALYGVALYALGTLAAPSLRIARIGGAMRVIGFPLATLMALALSFPYVYFDARDPRGVALWALLGTAAVALSASAILAVRRLRDRPGLIEPLLCAAAAVLVLVAAWTREGDGDEEFFAGSPTLQLLFAALFVGLVLAGVVAGTLRDELWLSSGGFALGMLGLALYFFDLGWNRLPRSLVMLAIGAVALAAAAAFERRRVT